VNASGEGLIDKGAGNAGAEGVGEIMPTPTDDGTARRLADFATLGEALDYAAQGRRGLIPIPSCGPTRSAAPAA
jgi:hypothetical protein